MFSIVKPGSTCWSLSRLLMVRPAPMSSMKEAATCRTIRPFRSVWRRSVDRPPDLSAGATDNDPFRAGTEPNTTPVATETVSV